ncbi:MAG: hypothetical protein ABSC65_15120 [Acidobacteriaceae bacterium]|jgi:hypothetical protein
MKPWKVVALLTLPMLLFAAWRSWSIYKERHAPVAVKQGPPEHKITQDDLVIPRKLYIESLKSAREQLKGKTVWMQAGYQLEYYPYHSGSPVFSEKKGPLPSNQELKVVDVVEVATPAKWLSRIPRGEKNIFLIVRKPDDPAEYAVPMGEVQGGSEEFRMDDLLYYDDPHKLYSHWPASAWQAIDQHQVTPGMSEMQTMMSVGQVAQSDSNDYGNRTVTYTAGDRKVIVTFAGDKATKVE